MHDVARQALIEQLREAATAEQRDAILDQFYDWGYRATLWDMDQWGLDPDNWMVDERAELASRGGTDWPAEAV